MRYAGQRAGPAPPKPLDNTAQTALLLTQNQGIPLNQPLVDNQRLGSFWVRANVSIPQAGISLPHELGRLPSGFIVMNSTAGAVIYQTGTDQSSSTPTVIVLRATSDTVGIILIG